ncbi:UxaA family hydrolase [Acetivibrio mesophilus]|uniref:Altronate dehydratase n=1 Tax=Acetivibrio mesophilus TaxID=2487273 RepID=A0A4Q0I2F9_9FIRM|nr:altronate dehydratase family protein [Acetivibrio mesophilus]ODM25343.1 altronate hydrolase [Clostridium sp. Bc-iso-3]RXE58420.1 altronate dehydratase [Acetivibrio mesophilus]HHV28646.1 altronate dehydratase [Clostridium sp.]
MDTNRNLALKIHEKDNIAVVLDNVKKGQKVLCGDEEITAGEDIDRGHKIALKNIENGDEVVKYGFSIGYASRSISKGEYIHTHNLRTALDGILEYTYNPKLLPSEGIQSKSTFMGFVRSDGRVGIRNEIWIINTVGCVNKISERLAREANERFRGEIDGVFAYTHPYGCSQMGEDQENTQKILAGLVNHPNAAGVLVLGLGCENNNIPEFKKVLGQIDEKRVRFLSAQDVEDEIDEGLKIIGELVEYASRFKRQECRASKLIVGLKCGGSDGFSGITANPLVGAFSDMLTAQGGISILTEVPEMFGAETLLMNRCVGREVFDKTVRLINDFKEYYMRHDQVIYDNPSPGNKKGGISTLEEKSLGCIQKGGRGNVTDVLDYGTPAKMPGLNLLKGPGNDIVASTALTASGAQMILFTTGRGTPLGAPVPTVKISTNTELYKGKHKWIDFDAGALIEGAKMEELAKEFWHYAMDVASGEILTKNEVNDCREIAIFKDGVTL